MLWKLQLTFYFASEEIDETIAYIIHDAKLSKADVLCWNISLVG